jgi:hypothetical protein
MPAARLIVCEKSPHWAVSLRNQLGERLPQVAETRSLASAASALAESPDSLVLLQISEANLTPAIEWLDQIGRQFPHARVAVALLPEMAQAECLLREAGAIEVYFGTHQAASAGRLARRHLALGTPEQLSLRQSIMSRMPWPAAATAPR